MRDYYLALVEDYGWLRVPQPDIGEMTVWISDYIKAAEVFGERVLLRRDVRPLAESFAGMVLEMWPVAAYFVLDLLIDGAIANQDLPSVVAYDIEIRWTGEGKEMRPEFHAPTFAVVRGKGVVDPNKTEDVYKRLWDEAALMLAAQTPSKPLELLLRGKVKRATSGRVRGGSELLDSTRPLIATRRPVAAPYQAVAYLNTVLKRKAAGRLALESAPEGAKLSTLRRYWKEGVSRNATREELARHAELKAQRRAHHVEGCLTMRQLHRALQTRALQVGHRSPVSLRSVRAALSEAERRLGRPPPSEGRVLRLDPEWCRLIWDIIEERLLGGRRK